MYEVDSKDEVLPISGPPQCSVGAPHPVVLADEHRTLLAYLVEDESPIGDGEDVWEVDGSSTEEQVALIRFHRCRAHGFGPPNNEAFGGHPLADRGLEPYGIFEIRHSSWVRRLERMNSVHLRHRPESFADDRHFVFSFHDSTFECVATGFDFVVQTGSARETILAAGKVSR